MAIKKYYRKLLLSNSPLKKEFKFEDKFQLLPFDHTGKPYSPYAKHFPLYLEYVIEYDKEEPTDIFEIGSIRQNVEKELINLLSCLTNHRFFNYDSSTVGWGIPLPEKNIDDLSNEEKNRLIDLSSQWFLGGYIYKGLKDDLQIESFTELNDVADLVESTMHEYYMTDPVDDERHEITFPNTMPSALHFYYSLSDKTRKRVNSCIYLACDGMDIVNTKRSLGFLSFVSAIEGLVGLEVEDDEIEFDCGSCKHIKKSPYLCPNCGRPIWGIKQKFVHFLSTFVAGSEKSQKVYRDVYNLRSKITHTGKLFMSDYEMSFNDDNIQKSGEEWLMRLKTLQLFRIALESWLRFPNKKRS